MSRRGRRILISVLSVLLVIIIGAGGTAWWMLSRVSGSIERIPDAFDIPEEQRPTPADDGSLNILLAGLDGEDSADEFERGAARTISRSSTGAVSARSPMHSAASSWSSTPRS